MRPMPPSGRLSTCFPLFCVKSRMIAVDRKPRPMVTGQMIEQDSDVVRSFSRHYQHRRWRPFRRSQRRLISILRVPRFSDRSAMRFPLCLMKYLQEPYGNSCCENDMRRRQFLPWIERNTRPRQLMWNRFQKNICILLASMRRSKKTELFWAPYSLFDLTSAAGCRPADR